MTWLAYKKSSYSGGPNGACVEVALNVPGVRAIRDSKDPDGPHLELAPPMLASFLATVKSGVLDRR